jgi:hypothetical protein
MQIKHVSWVAITVKSNSVQILINVGLCSDAQSHLDEGRDCRFYFLSSSKLLQETTNLFLAWWAVVIEYFSTRSNRIWMIIVLNVPHCRGAPLGVLHMQA